MTMDNDTGKLLRALIETLADVKAAEKKTVDRAQVQLVTPEGVKTKTLDLTDNHHENGFTVAEIADGMVQAMAASIHDHHQTGVCESCFWMRMPTLAIARAAAARDEKVPETLEHLCDAMEKAGLGEVLRRAVRDLPKAGDTKH